MLPAYLPPSNKIECPVCHQIVTRSQFATARDIEPAIAAFIHATYNNWSPEQGACSNCVHDALQALLQKLETEAHETAMTTPLYGILPVGLRLGVNNEYDGAGITIAFLDSGFAPHPDLEGRVKLYVDASTPVIREAEEVETAGDLSWHGMMTSVVACGNGSMSGGLYRGLASGANVLLIKVSSPQGQVNEEGIGRGLGWLLANGRRYGVNIVNISLGGDHPHHFVNNPVDLMVEALVAQGTLVVCASGNAGQRWLVPPASAPSAITVGGLDDKNTLSQADNELWHSNYGITRGGVWKPELVAPSLWLAAPVLPGSQVAREAEALNRLLSLPAADWQDLLADPEFVKQTSLPVDINEQAPELQRQLVRKAWQSNKLINPHYQHVDGTSFAAPIVSSVAAQMWQANPDLSPAGLKDLLLRTARYLPEVAPDQQGHGVVDPWAAVAAALTTSKKTVN